MHSLETLAAPGKGVRHRVCFYKSTQIGRAGFSWRAMDSDSAEHRYRADARDGAHIADEERYDAQFVSRYCIGFDKFRRYLLGLDDGAVKDAEWAATITGIPAETISRAGAAAPPRLPTMITCAWSLQRAHHGEQPYWAAIVLAAMLGAIGLPGTGFAFGHGSTNGIGVPRIDIAGPETRFAA